jgi:hypothetical protein
MRARRSLTPLVSLLALAVMLLAGCTIKQHVKAIESPANDEVCIVENPKVREGFLVEYQRTLKELGYEPRLLEPDSSTNACGVTSTYVARWSWDVTIYLSYAEIRVFAGGAPAGEAIYDSTRGGFRLIDKFIDAEPKIRELVTELFPARR